MCTQKMRALSYIGAKKITFPPKPDIHTDRQTYKRTDISVYRVASLLNNTQTYLLAKSTRGHIDILFPASLTYSWLIAVLDTAWLMDRQYVIIVSN